MASDSQLDRQKRNAVRIDIERLPLELWICRLQRCDLCPAHLLNISGSGALIESKRAFAPRLRLHGRFWPLDKATLFCFAIVVVRCMPASRPNAFNLAVTLHFAQEGKRDLLIKWVFDQAARQLRAQYK